ncbi:hypothetical protein JHD48_07170 [Sulfurimonas sp. SAG-AH-194-I05]|nr:hypothetical protein [Sulfurimonas sp. SAG-AH-194-I05]MDF1875510.1 hypothetical protein [Sulfurimonas sp. SAG-AH-194-I05]
MEPRLVQAPISLVFSQADMNEELFEREYHQLSESDDNAINQWLKLAKARGETSDTDPILLNLVVELHNKIDALELLIKDEVPVRLSLTCEAEIYSIGFEYFKLSDALLDEGVTYYGRIEMPVHPKRDVGVFFIAKNAQLAQITRIHDRDEKEWAAYMTARERVLIREAKESK